MAVSVKTPELCNELFEQLKVNQAALKKNQDMTNLMLENFNKEREEERRLRLSEIESQKQERLLNEQQLKLLKDQLAQAKANEQKPSGSGISRPGDLKSSLNVSPTHWLNRNKNIPRIEDCTNRVRIGLRALNGKDSYYKQALQQCEKEVREDIRKYEAYGYKFVMANPSTRNNLNQIACDRYQINECKDQGMMRGTHRDRNFYFVSHICDLCNRLRGANLEHNLAECDLLVELQRLENACPTNEIDSYYFRKITNQKNEPNNKKPIREAEPKTLTQPEPAHDVQVLLVRNIKKEPQQ